MNHVLNIFSEVWLECVSEPSVHDLSLQTLGSSIMSRGASLSKTKQENISLFLCFVSPLGSFLFSSRILHILFLSLRLSLSVPLPSIKGSLYCLYKGTGVVNRCRVMGSLLAARLGEGRTPPLPYTHTHAGDTLLMDCTHHSSKLCHWQWAISSIWPKRSTGFVSVDTSSAFTSPPDYCQGLQEWRSSAKLRAGSPLCRTVCVWPYLHCHFTAVEKL